MTESYEIILLMGGWWLSLAACALLWKRHAIYRALPVIYGLVAGGVFVIRFGLQGWQAAEWVFVFFGVGCLFLFSLWIENWNPRKPQSTEKR